jgi:pimeloyl-ACP methyl ester carboxylesterase
MARIESLLSARLWLSPQLVDGRLYFLSNLSGRLSLYVMDEGGSVPEPLLPPHIALQNPELIAGRSFCVTPRLGKLLVMIDRDGDERYQPLLTPLDGGFPEPAFGDQLANDQVFLLDCDPERLLVYLVAQSLTEPIYRAYRGDLQTGELTLLGVSEWGNFVVAVNEAHTQIALIDGYTVGDNVLYLWEQATGKRRLLYGTPLEERGPDYQGALTGFGESAFTPDERGLLIMTTLFDDAGGLGYIDLDQPQQIAPIVITGVVHRGAGELEHFERLDDDRYLVRYNIDGVSWAYEGRYDHEARRITLEHVLCGQHELANGVLHAIHYDKRSDRFALSFVTASTPTQLYTVEGADRQRVAPQTRERILGTPAELLAPGEDASFTSFDGQRISARLYLPTESLGFSGPRPLVYYIHGGPQGQERPDFAWFSMPLIQFLTLNGFAVFVPNVRGSTGYGLRFTKLVDRDWGGDDRLDHVHAMSVLAKDSRIDTSRAGVIGRSYGGYMTLTLAMRHPELWSAAVDMFGPANLLTFLDRVPPAARSYFSIAIGDPEKDRDMLVERSPVTYAEQLACPMLVIQGANDPRVVEQESRELVERLKGMGKSVEYLLFPNEGHDVLKYENRVRCYNAITQFFAEHLQPARREAEAKA